MGKYHTEAQRARRHGGPHIRENNTQRHRGHRGARAGARAGLYTGWKNHAEARRAQRIFCGGKFSHGGHGDTEGRGRMD